MPLLARGPSLFDARVREARAIEGASPELQAQWAGFADDRAAFIRECVSIYDSEARAWIPFDLWPAQEEVLELMRVEPRLAILKARQLGLTWLVLAFYLSEMLFSPIATVLLFSKRETEAKVLLERLKDMYEHLPEWIRRMQPATDPDNTLVWTLTNGSVARAFPTNAGDSYTATHALADEFDLVDNQGSLLNSVQPTVEAGGKLILLSRVDKSKPETEFKRIYRAAKEGENGWRAVFLPWHVRPSRTPDWYEAMKRDILSRTGALDDLYEQYPGVDTEALSPRSLDKRIPGEWLSACYKPVPAITKEHVPKDAPAIPGLVIYTLPEGGIEYVIGCDPAEGNPTSDDSALTVLRKDNGEEVCKLAGKYEPTAFAGYIVQVGKYYNNAGALIERNNHGHSVIATCKNTLGYGLYMLMGTDGKTGWLTTNASKTAMYDNAAQAFQHGDTVLRSFDTFNQLASIDGNKQAAPDGQMDDKATSYALALQARLRKVIRAASSQGVKH